MNFGRVRRWVAAWGVLALVSCGGGGGGGSDSTSVTVNSDRSSLQFVSFKGALPQPQVIRFTVAEGSGTFYGVALPDDPTSVSATLSSVGGLSAEVTVALLVPPTSGRSGSITFKLCADAQCDRVAWSRSIPYAAKVFDVDATSITDTGFEGAAGSTRTVTINPPDDGQLISVASATTSGNGWLAVKRLDAARLEVSTSGVGQLPGAYQGQVNLQLAGAQGSSWVIPVSFTVGAGAIAPAVAPVSVTVDATRASLERSVRMAFNGGLRPAWSANADQPWLVLTQASGVGPGDLRFTVDTAQLGAIANWGAGHARVTVKSAGISDLQFDVELRKQWPEVHWVAQGTVVAGRGSTVRLTGRGFSQLPSVSRILVAGTPAVGVIQSDTQAVLDLPALPVGRHSVKVDNAAGVPVRGAAVGAAAPFGMDMALARNDGEKRSAMFDATRNAIYAVNFTQNALVRFRNINGSWVIDGLPIASINDMAMGPDMATLYVGSGERNLLEVDPDTMQVVATHSLPAGSFATLTEGRFTTKGMAMTRDMRLWFGGAQWTSASYFDILRGEFASASLTTGLAYSPYFFSSADGSRMAMSQNGISPAPGTLSYSPDSGVFNASPALPYFNYEADYSADGTRVLFDDSALHDASTGALIGSVQLTGAINLGSVLSPDGRRIYTLVTQNDNSLFVDHINVYDTTQVEPGTSRLLKLGQLPVGAQPLSCGGQYGCSVRGLFFISPVGDTLFWLGNQGLVTIPVQNALAGTQSARRVLPASIR